MKNCIFNGLPCWRSVFLAWLGLALMGSSIQAQTIFKNISPNGVVTYSDTPPLGTAGAVSVLGRSQSASNREASAAVAAPVDSNAQEASAPAASAGLSPALQLVVSRYPVTLLTNSGCSRCAQARSLLQARGIPFAENVIATPNDLELFANLTGATVLPVLTIGNLPVKNFSAQEWNSFLDAAGYPKSSSLPVGHKNSPPVAWRPPASMRSAAKEEPRENRRETQAPPPQSNPEPRLVPMPTPENPGNIVF